MEAEARRRIVVIRFSLPESAPPSGTLGGTDDGIPGRRSPSSMHHLPAGPGEGFDAAIAVCDCFISMAWEPGVAFESIGRRDWPRFARRLYATHADTGPLCSELRAVHGARVCTEAYRSDHTKITIILKGTKLSS